MPGYMNYALGCVKIAGGKLLDYLGYELGSEPRELTQEERDKAVSLFNEIVGMVRRQRINAPMHAGVMGLDAFVPIGQGLSIALRTLPPTLHFI
ncbi:hypothetical protein AK812_SmicGene22529 [Symbiodinium microadriaticum]|uniref:Uncharacterized protein n=1 Tax=Symbiodinium microadriaticum TaxID=2951 RepID=A0A1Q9DJL5_SYMMI|nr:hypothetical protein AK812_SmicGene22529 [Symbiodinium microadriaticum]